jgi:hypothetical protein
VLVLDNGVRAMISNIPKVGHMKTLSSCLSFGYAADWQRLTTAVLPAMGVSMILFCIASFFFPFGQRFKEADDPWIRSEPRNIGLKPVFVDRVPAELYRGVSICDKSKQRRCGPQQ